MSLAAALALALKGCRVFPIQAGTKKPAITCWPEQSTTDETAIRKWWAKWPTANVGIHTRGFLVIDIDGPVGHANLQHLRHQHEIPHTLRIESGNLAEPHHYQLLFRLPEGLRSWNKALSKFPGFGHLVKIDIKTDRGQIVGPGSRHHTGGMYRWAAEPSSVPREATLAPGWMLAALCRPSATETKGRPETSSDDELLNVIANRFPITGPGQRNQQSAIVVSYLVGKGLSQERVVRLASAWVRSFAGLYETAVEIAEREILSLTVRTFQSLQKGSFELMPDHQERTAALQLPTPVLDWFEKFCNPFIAFNQGIQGTNQSTKHVLCSGYSRFSQPAIQFLYCVLLHCHYEMRSKGFAEKVLMTDRQLISIHEKVFGKKLSWDTLIRQKRQFISHYQADGTFQKATGKELLVLEVSGHFGNASIYRLTGLLGAFHCNNPESCHVNDVAEGS